MLPLDARKVSLLFRLTMLVRNVQCIGLIYMLPLDWPTTWITSLQWLQYFSCPFRLLLFNTWTAFAGLFVASCLLPTLLFCTRHVIADPYAFHVLYVRGWTQTRKRLVVILCSVVLLPALAVGGSYWYFAVVTGSFTLNGNAAALLHPETSPLCLYCITVVVISLFALAVWILLVIVSRYAIHEFSTAHPFSNDNIEPFCHLRAFWQFLFQAAMSITIIPVTSYLLTIFTLWKSSADPIYALVAYGAMSWASLQLVAFFSYLSIGTARSHGRTWLMMRCLIVFFDLWKSSQQGPSVADFRKALEDRVIFVDVQRERTAYRDLSWRDFLRPHPFGVHVDNIQVQSKTRVEDEMLGVSGTRLPQPVDSMFETLSGDHRHCIAEFLGRLSKSSAQTAFPERASVAAKYSVLLSPHEQQSSVVDTSRHFSGIGDLHEWSRKTIFHLRQFRDCSKRIAASIRLASNHANPTPSLRLSSFIDATSMSGFLARVHWDIAQEVYAARTGNHEYSFYATSVRSEAHLWSITSLLRCCVVSAATFFTTELSLSTFLLSWLACDALSLCSCALIRPYVFAADFACDLIWMATGVSASVILYLSQESVIASEHTVVSVCSLWAAALLFNAVLLPLGAIKASCQGIKHCRQQFLLLEQRCERARRQKILCNLLNALTIGDTNSADDLRRMLSGCLRASEMIRNGESEMNLLQHVLRTGSADALSWLVANAKFDSEAVLSFVDSNAGSVNDALDSSLAFSLADWLYAWNVIAHKPVAKIKIIPSGIQSCIRDGRWFDLQHSLPSALSLANHLRKEFSAPNARSYLQTAVRLRNSSALVIPPLTSIGDFVSLRDHLITCGVRAQLRFEALPFQDVTTAVSYLTPLQATIGGESIEVCSVIQKNGDVANDWKTVKFAQLRPLSWPVAEATDVGSSTLVSGAANQLHLAKILDKAVMNFHQQSIVLDSSGPYRLHLSTAEDLVAVYFYGLAMVTVYDVITKKITSQLQLPPVDVVSTAYPLQFLGSSSIAVGFADGSVSTVDLSTGSMSAICGARSAAVTAICTSANGRVLIAGFADGSLVALTLVSLEKHVLLNQTSGSLSPSIQHVCCSNDGSLLLAVSVDRMLSFWDVATSTLIKCTATHQTPVIRVRFHRKRHVAATLSSEMLCVWDAQVGALVFSRTFDDKLSVCDVQFCADNRVIVLLYKSGNVEFIPTFGERLLNILWGRKASLACLAVDEETDQAFTGSIDGNVAVWNLRSDAIIHVFNAGITAPIVALAVNHAASRLCTITGDGRCHFFDLNTYLRIDSSAKPNSRIVPSLSLCRSGKRALYATSDALRCWDHSCCLPELVLTSATDKIKAVCFVGDDKFAACGGEDGGIRFWSLKDWTVSNRISAHDSSITCLTADQHQKVLVSGATDGTLKVWDTYDGSLLQELKGHTDAVTCTCIDAKCSLIASGSVDRSCRVWDLRTGECVLVFPQHSDTVTGVAFCDPLQIVVSSCFDGALRLFSYEA